MGIYLNPEKEGFERAVRSKIYVDKSELIAYTNDVLNTEQQYICVSRPRRFGKSIAAKMLAAYYCRTCDSRELFQNLKIAEVPSFTEHLNRYNVIFVNMQQIISSAGNMEFTDYLQQEILAELREVYPDFVSEKETRLPSALEDIYAKTRQRFVFIIDEWDCVFREQKQDSALQITYLDFLRNLLKDRIYVCLAYMTGILPIKKYGTHSALNMFDEFSMTDQKRLAEYTGFTEAEVQALCEQYQMDFAETKRWYDGYSFRRARHIYNPKSVVTAMLNEEFGSYWTQTETYEALRVYIDMNFDGLKDAVIEMLGGGRCRINPGTFSNDMTTFQSKDDVLTLLVHLGYLTYDIETKEVLIPNEEVRGEFVNATMVSGWQEIVRSVSMSEQLLDDTIAGHAEAVAQGMDLVHTESTSILSYHNENSLSCAVSLAYYSARAYYTLVRELPAGKGFADIVFIPHRAYAEKPALIVELKWDQSADGAIEQIKRKQYVDALKDYTGQILLVGINYDKASKKHQCRIERIQK